MLTNTDITIYHRQYDKAQRRDRFVRTYVPAAWWHKRAKSAVGTEGLQVADEYTVRIPDASVTVGKDDYIVKGNHQGADSVRDLAGTEHFKVLGVNESAFGDHPHSKVVGA